MKKRASSLVLALTLCLGLLPTAQAAGIVPTVAIPFQYEDALGFSEGLAAVEIDTGEKNQYGNPICKWGYIDKTGKTVIPFQYDGATNFSEGWAAVKKGNYWGYIDKTGKEMIVSYNIDTGEIETDANYRYSQAEPFSQNLAAVYYNTDWHYIDKAGESRLTSKKYEKVGPFGPEGYATVLIGDWRSDEPKRWTLIDKTGREVPFAENYKGVRDFQDGLAVVLAKEEEVSPYEVNRTLSRDGYVDQNGAQVLPCRYLSASPFSEGRAMVSDEWLSTGRGPQTYADGSIGAVMACAYKLIDKTGTALTPAKYSGYHLFSEGLMAVGVDFTTAITPEHWGFIDLTGKEIVPCEYDEVKDFSQGLAAVRRSGRWGFVDKTGQEVIPCQYEGATSFSDGMAAVKKEEKWGFISVDGYVAPNASQPAPAPAEKPSAYAATQAVLVDGKAVTFQCYALQDASGNMTNYIKLRDLANILNGSAAQFQVGWDGSVTITTKTAYTPVGGEGNTPFSGDRAYQEATAATKVNGQVADLDAFVLNDDTGGGYTYYQLRDLGKVLGFNVGWSGEKGVYIETDKPYDKSN